MTHSPAPTHPDFSFEDAHLHGPVCGVDEVGRGPLAGPVVAAAVILRRDTLPPEMLEAVNDSKKLTAKKREYLFHRIHDHADVSIAACTVEEIDSLNILQASLLAMARAVEGLGVAPALALIDGNKTPKLKIPARAIIGGDAKSLSIAAASIVAKHHRDMLMQEYAREFPHYGWEKNAGYGTATHLAALDIHGVTPLHRRSFAPIRDRLSSCA